MYKKDSLLGESPEATGQAGMTTSGFTINPAIKVVILNPSPVTLSETKGLVVQLWTGAVKDLVTA